MARIKGKIIRIIDPRTVIIDLGKKDGVTSSSMFSILADAEPVIHPDTGEELGRVPVVKAKVKSSQVYDKFTIATASWTYSRFTGLDVLANMMSVQKVDQELLVEPKDVEPWKAQSEIPVRKGDIVEVEVSDSDFSSENVQSETLEKENPKQQSKEDQ